MLVNDVSWRPEVITYEVRFIFLRFLHEAGSLALVGVYVMYEARAKLVVVLIPVVVFVASLGQGCIDGLSILDALVQQCLVVRVGTLTTLD